MEIFVHNNQFHVLRDNKVYASFNYEQEAKAFIESCNRKEFVELTPEQEQRLLTVDDLILGKKQEKLPDNEIGEFKFLGLENIKLN